jgi:hypothetical protein
VFKLSSMSCSGFWLFIGVVGGFGDTAFAGDLIDPRSPASVSVVENFTQAVYQFASSHAAATFYSQLNAKYRSCRTLTESDAKGGTARRTIRSQSKQHVGERYHAPAGLVLAHPQAHLPGHRPPVTAAPRYVRRTLRRSTGR